MEPLAQMEYVPYRAGEPAITEAERREYLNQLPDWQIVQETDVPRLARAFTFPDFASALAFTDRVGAMAERAGHHPALLTEWGRVTVSWWTHDIGGVHRNDYILAARTDELYKA